MIGRWFNQWVEDRLTVAITLIIERREKERDLFFDGVWTADGKATIYDVSKPSYSPAWSSARRVDISADLAAAMKATEQ